MLFDLTRFVILATGASTLLLAGPATAQDSRCADCHFANPTAPRQDHLEDWDRSPHGRNRVGCETCHGGDPTTFESFLAHQGILNSRNPASPVHRWNLPRTCGACHTGPFVAFQDSKHFELLRSGDEAPPTCSTCHGEVAAKLLSPRGLERRCETCHGNDRIAPNSDFPPQGRILLEDVEEVRQLLDRANELIRRVDDEQRRESLEDAFEQAEVPLVEAVRAGHAFVFDRLQERLAVSRERVNEILNAFANPKRE